MQWHLMSFSSKVKSYMKISQPKEYVQKDRDFAQNEARLIGPNYIPMERASQEKKKIP